MPPFQNPHTPEDIARITRRVVPCACGCEGRDSWHAATFRRRLYDVHAGTGSVRVTAYREPKRYIATATVNVPWADERVPVVLLPVVGWFFVQ